MKPRGSLVVVVLLVILAKTTSTEANHGRFLLNAEDNLDILLYFNRAPTMFDHDVFCPLCNMPTEIGEIKFDYDTYLREGRRAVGAARSGGFYLAPNIILKSGYSLAWVQTVISTRTGPNAWEINPQAGPFEVPDATRRTPAYREPSTAATPP